ncbi:ArsA family ATPase [Bdellovibrio bacteriovorus]|uniref:arsenite-transporting ATPase n=1 Tax=Bdellovibrio bacteriovorus str. Tiberius TaxID=1069642 RepID=K7ZCL7_BDEBC|nr:ArsA-related P-loop ATPase [Bdellovibrio bacteriovorus]AFY03319.1 adventurous gliding motility protein R [Bdellovibrio bacteriovorus str. Tiberius]
MSLFKDTKVLVCVGSGGVGKTTIAASLAVLAAKEGKRVLVLTIDPAKRLAQTLGIEGTKDITKVPGQNFKGELYASVIDHKKTFDDFVARAAKKTESAQKIFNNSLYKQLSTNLSGSQEFTALEKLYSCYESGQFDLIVLDTPPTKHAIDFLNAPQKLSALFNEGVAKWFRDPEGKKGGFFGHLLQTGTRQVLKVLESLTGSNFIRELGDFFVNIEQWQGKLQARTIDVHRMLVAPTTQFCLVTAFDQAKLKEAEYFSREIKKGGYHLGTVVLNRVFPYWLDLRSAQDPGKGHEDLVKLYSQMRSYYNQRDQLYQQFESGMKNQARVFRIPDLVKDISDLGGLEELSALIVEGEKKA